MRISLTPPGRSPATILATAILAAMLAACAPPADPASVKVDSIAVAPKDNAAATIATSGGTLDLVATVLPAGADNKAVTWSVSPGSGDADIDADTGRLTADLNGTVTAIATAKDGSGVYGSLEVTIAVPVESITVAPAADAPASITGKGGWLQLVATVSPREARDTPLPWSLAEGSPPGVTIDSSTGALAAAGLSVEENGTAGVVATAIGAGASGTDVASPASNVTIQQPSIEMAFATINGTVDASHGLHWTISTDPTFQDDAAIATNGVMDANFADKTADTVKALVDPATYYAQAWYDLDASDDLSEGDYIAWSSEALGQGTLHIAKGYAVTAGSSIRACDFPDGGSPEFTILLSSGITFPTAATPLRIDLSYVGTGTVSAQNKIWLVLARSPDFSTDALYAYSSTPSTRFYGLLPAADWYALAAYDANGDGFDASDPYVTWNDKPYGSSDAIVAGGSPIALSLSVGDGNP